MTSSRVAVATLLCLGLAPLARAGLIPGGGPAASDCYVEFDVQNVVGQSSTVTCLDGDPCDTDGACNGTCKFHLLLQTNQPSAVCAGNAPLKLKKPKLKGAQAIFAPDSVRSLTGPTYGPFDVPVKTKTKRGVQKPGKVTVSVTAISKSKPHRDADKLTLVCTPRVGACPPPPPSSTSTTSTSTSTSLTTSTVTTSTSTTLSPDVCPGLGLRILSGSTDSHAYSSALFGGQIDVAPDNISGSLVLCAGPQGADGVAPLSLAADAKSGIRVTMGQGFFCGQVEAVGSSGKLDCDGGTPVDVDYSIDSHGTNANDPPVLRIEQGSAGAAGSAYFTANVRSVLCPLAPAIGAASGTPACIGPVANTGDCYDATKVDFSQVASVTLTFSTGLVNAHVVNPRPSLGPSMINRSGVAFDCANWKTENGPGSFILPFLLTDGTFSGVRVGDVANVLQIID